MFRYRNPSGFKPKVTEVDQVDDKDIVIHVVDEFDGQGVLSFKIKHLQGLSLTYFFCIPCINMYTNTEGNEDDCSSKYY